MKVQLSDDGYANCCVGIMELMKGTSCLYYHHVLKVVAADTGAIH